MKISTKSLEKVTTILEEPTRILKAFCIGPVENPIENDFLNHDLNNIFSSDNGFIEEGQDLCLVSGEKYKVFYTDKANEFNAGIQFSDYSFKENQRIFLFANIYSDMTRDCILRFGKFCTTKTWINNILVFNGYPNINEENMALFQLQKGNNIVIAEYFPTDVWLGDIYSLRINELNTEPTQFENDIMTDYLSKWVEGNARVVSKNYITKNNSYSFLVMPIDFFTVDKKRPINISIYDSSKTKIGNMQAELYQIVKIDKAEYFSNIRNDVFININITYYTVDGASRKLEFTIINDEFLKQIEHVSESFEALLPNSLSQKQGVFLEGILNDFKKASSLLKNSLQNSSTQEIDIKRYLYYFNKIKHILSSKEPPMAIEELIFTKGEGTAIYHKSKLDKKIKKINISIPKDYSSEKAYPLVIHLFPLVWQSSAHYHELIPKNASEDIIFASISTRNVTLGSYMGEACIFESIEEVKGMYNIDVDRIYILGFSNDSYACWNLIQAYPHIFAAAVPLSGGLYLKNMDNNLATPFLSIYGDKDLPVFSGLIKEIDAWVEKNKALIHSQLAIIKEADHWIFYPTMFYNKLIINWLLQYKKKRFNKKSYYRTERIHHNGNEWIKILGVEPASDFCEFALEVKSNSEISINMKSITEFTLSLPDYINKGKLTLTINDDDMIIEEIHDKAELSFAKTGDRYLLSEGINEPIYSTWGMGILSVFMDSLKIIIPSTFESSNEEKIINHIANEFSKPKSQGYDPNVDVEYPIHKDEETGLEMIGASNVVLVGHNDNNKHINYFKDKLALQIDKDGYYYNNKYFKKSYGIIFIQQNPINPAYKILIVYTNDASLLRKNLILRKLIIPTYVNGYHPYLNCELIVFNEKETLVADTIGDELYKP